MMQLHVKQIFLPQPPVAPPASFPFVKPITYEFRVAEHVDGEGKIHKVGLQVQTWEYDEFGVGHVNQPWSDVPRVQVPHIG